VTAPLAIVGIGCRLPGGSDDAESFGRLLSEGRSGIREVPADRWHRDRFHHPDVSVPGAMITKWAGFVDNPDQFDAQFWSISPREAVRMDPQQRWLLEVCWEALEDSGTPPRSLRGSPVGVFVGISSNDYATLQVHNYAHTDVHTISGSTSSIAANRISYQLDLRGPSLAVDTACSSALVAVWAACRSIWSGCCNAALAGGVNALLTPELTIAFSKAQMCSPNGQCFTFDARADGYVRGEGAAVVYIKPLDRALADGDRIYALIRSAVSNQDGHTSSMTVPSADAQAALLREAYREAGLSPKRVSYMEAHGTGTPVGDPIEAAALGRVLGDGRPADQPCLVGSVKTNIGHLEAGSGAVGLIKAALVLHRGAIPPNRNFETPNPVIPFESLGLKVVTELQPLPGENGSVPIAGVNSFGFGGANAHVVLEQAPRPANGEPARPRLPRPHVLPISARTKASLRRYVESYLTLLEDPAIDLAEVCYSAGARKEQHDDRLVVIGEDTRRMRQRLSDWLRQADPVDGVVTGRPGGSSPPVFVYTGQGAQWWGMGRVLLDREPVFRATVAEIDGLLRPLADWSLVAELTRNEAESRIDRTDVAQPAIFALQVALTELWRSWGVRPGRVVGHSVGEVAAAYAAGVYTLPDAVRVIFHRSRLQHTTAGRGRMLAAGVSPAEARRLIGPEADCVQVAAVNSPALVTLAGDTEALERTAARLERAGKFVRWLPVAYAFHTQQMDSIRNELLLSLADIQPRPVVVPFISTVTGLQMPGERLDAAYWWKNVRQPVQFAPAIAALIRGGEDTFLEVGPHPALAASIHDCLKEQGRPGVVFHSLRRAADDSHEMLTNLAGLHVRGVEVDWAVVNQSSRIFVPLPRYPWDHETFWLESPHSRQARLAPHVHPLLGLRVPAPQPTWELDLHPLRFPDLADHRLWDGVVFPAAGFAEIGIAVSHLLFPGEDYAVEGLEIKKALFLNEDRPPTIQVVFDPAAGSYSVYGSTDGKQTWDLHAQGRLTRVGMGDRTPVDLAALRRRLTDHLDHERYYVDLIGSGYQFGPNFKQVRNVWRVQGEALSEIVVPDALSDYLSAYHIHPAVLDACFHIFKGLDPAFTKDDFYVPVSIRRVHLHVRQPPTRLWAHGRLIRRDDQTLLADIFVYDEHGNSVGQILGFRTDRVERKHSEDPFDQCFYQFHWEAEAPPGDEPRQDRPGAMVETGTYVVLADSGGVSDALGARLRECGHRVMFVRAGDGFKRNGDTEFTVSLDGEADLHRAFADLGCPTDELSGVVHCWSLDHPQAGGLSLEQLWSAQQTGLLSALAVVHAVAAAPPRQLWFVTRGAATAAPGDAVDGLASAPLAGLLRVANNEHFPSRFTLIDLDATTTDAEIENLFHEVTAGDGEREIAYRAGHRHVLRLGRVRPDELPPRVSDAVRADAVVPFRLQTSKPGILTNLALHETQRRDPGPNEIEIRVRAWGLNFRDVMKALGTYPGDPSELLWFGDDVAGTVERVGSNVRQFQPGDAVAAIFPYAFQSYATADAGLAYRMPPNISFTEAATLPTAFLTAHYALARLARLQPGESVLIHAGSGGVGQAAIQVAQHLGLQIFATAGTPEKRQRLRDMGVHHLMNSRSVDFADEVMRITGGRGVDAVLNSLAGDFIPKSLSVLAPFGRFLEIGKIDIYKNTRIGLEPLKNNVSYFVIDVSQLKNRTGYWAALMRELGEHCAAGHYKPLPYDLFPVTEAAEAFRHMAQARHVGKVVLSFDIPSIPIRPCTAPEHQFRPDRTYLITGGSSGFGLELAKWLSRHGARHLVLFSRSGPRDEVARADIEAMRTAGVTVVDARGDVARAEDVTAVVERIRAELPPLAGVIHAAMALDDDFLAELDRTRFVTAISPKIAGAWNLHTATLGLPLEHFVCLSSYSAVVGAPKQSNYCAGNCFLDALAHYRRARGLPALTINWGAMLGAGFVERNRNTADFLSKVGVQAFTMPEALAVFGRLAQLDPVQVAAARLDWRLLSRFCSGVGQSNTYAALCRASGAADGGGSLWARLQAAEQDDRVGLLERYIAAQVAGVFGVAAEKVDRDTSLTNLGLDSLMALELANRLERDVATSIPMSSLLGGPSIRALARTILRALDQAGTVDREAGAAPSGDGAALTSADLEAGSDEHYRIITAAEAERALAGVTFDGAALSYLPDKLVTVGGLTNEQMLAAFGSEPFVSNFYETSLGRICVIMLPFRSHALVRQDEVREPIRQALELATRHGARFVSLTGLIPSLTGYGRDLAAWIGDRPGYPALTTGHATTSAAVIHNLGRILAVAGRELEDEALTVLGLGSIGQSCLRLMLEVCPHPRELILGDVFERDEPLRAFADALAAEHGFRGRIRIATSRAEAPPEVYEGTTILAAVSVPEVLDVSRLRPGTLVMDDSYPPAFSVAAAVRRLEAETDILFSNAGMLRLPTPIRETIVVPAGGEEFLSRFGVAAFREEVVRDPHELTACVLSSLLTARPDGAFPPTIGLAGLADLVGHYRELGGLDIGPARLQCDNYFVPDEAVDRFGSRFGRLRGAASPGVNGTASSTQIVTPADG